jgi:hypothetical protein
MAKPISSRELRDQMQAGSSIQPQGAENPIQTFDILDNPLERLINGPMDLEELALEGRDMIDLRLSLIEGMLNTIEAEPKTKVLLPPWWTETPESFLLEMRDSLTLQNFKPSLPLERQQLKILEALLNMWLERL